MLLQRLVADADLILAERPETSVKMYNVKPVKWIIDLTADGGLRACIPQTGEGRRADRGRETLVPVGSTRTSGIRAVLLADNANYVLGIPRGDDKVAARHRAFLELHRAAAHALPDSGIGAVLRFLESLDSGAITLGQPVAAGELVTFRVAGELVSDSPVVRAWWASNWDSDGTKSSETESSGATGQCVVCGRSDAPIDGSLPVNLKGIPKGQSSGTALVSINEEAFESLNLERGTTSRVCRDCGETAMKCLNTLLAQDSRSVAVGPLVYVYWASGSTKFNPFDYLREPDPDEVGQLLRSTQDGRERTIDTSEYHIVCLSASAGRAVIRDWIDVTGPQLRESLRRWFELQREVDPYGTDGEPRGVWRMAAAAFRDARKEMDASIPRALVRTALEGERMPSGLLARVVGRCRLEQNVTYERAMLIKALFASQHGWKAGKMTALEPQTADSAYQSGRVMAVLEDIQHAALGKVGATVIDKYYGAASAAPASVLGRLVGDAQNHLAKLRRDRPGLHALLQKRLEDVLAGIDSFPRTLTLERQGMFALGYYHERAALRASRSKTDPADVEQSTDLIEEEVDE
jgi:CRISPR-associated protein Csd1